MERGIDMSEISVKINVLAQKISELESLKQSCNNAKSNPPSTVGGGKTVNELEEIGKLYKTMYDHFLEMISSTISFMQKTKDGFESSDREAASEIKK